MSERSKWSVGARFKSVGYALQGLRFMLRTQPNAWLHVGASIAVVGLACILKVSPADWRWLIAAMSMVWVAEGLNTAIEYVCDAVSPGYSQAVKHAKDIAAASVLICALAAAVIGLLSFWPYIFGSHLSLS